MTTNAIYDLLIDSALEHLTGQWTIARLNVQFLANGQDIEFIGTYLDSAGEVQPLSTDFPDDLTEAMQVLYQRRKQESLPRANKLQMDLTPAGKYTVDYGWDQEIQDEDEHFSNGGTVREWQAIRAAKYGDQPA
ncbi:MAG: hypothetical protein LH609_10420 [Rudanella sp.]|nr:hypothetical protein [Rudanella sp.]